MKKAAVLSILVVAILLAVGVVAEAQQPTKVARIGLLSATSRSNLAARIDALRQGLRELGYVEGGNIIIEYRFADSKLERQLDQARELARLKVDLIITGGPVGTRAAKKVTSTIPIVMAGDNDPVSTGFVASLSHPGGNITGFSTLSPEVSGKQLELLKESIANFSRVAVVGNSAEPGNAQSLRETQLAGSAFGVDVQYLELQARKDIETIFTSIKQQHARALIVLRNPIAGGNRKRIIDLMAASRLPGMHAHPNWVKAGGLMFYGASTSDIWRRAASYVDKILKGTKPADLPVQQPMKFEFIVNLKTAKQIGLTIPPNVLVRANRVIQ